MAEDTKPEGRTAHIEKNMKDGVLKNIVMGVSKLGDAVGYTQEKEYKGKTTADLMKKSTEPEKKAKGGKISSASSRADGCAQRGKTKGRMV